MPLLRLPVPSSAPSSSMSTWSTQNADRATQYHCFGRTRRRALSRHCTSPSTRVEFRPPFALVLCAPPSMQPLTRRLARCSLQAKAQAYRRLVSVIGMTKTGTPSKDEDPSLYQPGGLLQYASRYGVGATRPVSLFYQLFMIDVVHHRSEKLCGFVRSASLHRLFQKHLRKDGRGIDVSSVNINEVR